ncbi:MAG: hypothetical protein JXA30_01825 [Deltaproteobacteria bacterium]|nr:hypothetical protein [Deltaproteobacteria bacterium]
MAEETLVEGFITDAIKLIDALDKQGDNPTRAVWYYFSDAEKWQLVLAGPSFDQFLSTDQNQAYLKVATAITQANVDSISIADVKLMRTDDKLLQATKYVIKTSPNSVVRALFRDSTINGIFVKEMLVLRAA